MVSSWNDPSPRSMLMTILAWWKAVSAPTAAEPNWFRTNEYTR
jgi:hypothetical protein